MSDYFVRNASFLRCDNITLGYSFKNLFRGNSDRGIKGRIYATVQNPFIVSKYKGLIRKLAAEWTTIHIPVRQRSCWV